MRKSAAAKRDRQLMHIIHALQRMHLKQWQIERQRCENNYIIIMRRLSATMNSANRLVFWFEDSMSVFKTLATKLQKERKQQYSQKWKIGLLVQELFAGQSIVVCGTFSYSSALIV